MMAIHSHSFMSLTSVMSAITEPKIDKSSGSDSQKPTDIPPMEYVEVWEKAGDCKRMSRLIMGTDHLGKMPNEETVEVLNEAVKLGINTFDTAPIYVDGIEKRLGDWLKPLNRSDLYTISKGGFPFDLDPGTYRSRLKGSRKQIAENVQGEIEESFRQLNNDITIYLMHRDDVNFKDYERVPRVQTPVKTILEALNSSEIRCKYKMLGLSNWDTPRINESQTIADEYPNLVRPMFSSPYFSLMEMGPVTIHSGGVQVLHDDMMNPDFQKGIKIMSYSPLGGFGGFDLVTPGWETAKQYALDLKTLGDRYWRNVHDSIFHKENEKRYKRAIEFTDQFNKKHGTTYTPDQIMNAYVLAHTRTDFLIIGPLTIEQLRRTVCSLSVARMLTKKDLDYLYCNPD